MKIAFQCALCGKPGHREAGAINRARRSGLSVYCDRDCAGIARQKNERSDAQKRIDKAAYDARYRVERAEDLKRRRAAFHKRTYDREKAAVERKKRAAFHAEYCRRPEYREWKSAYDRAYRAEKEFGEYAEAFLALRDLEQEILTRMTRYEIDMANGTFGKAQKRKREYEALIRC